MIKQNKLVLEIVCVIIVILIFSIVLFEYYGTKQKVEKENPRFVDINYEQLQKEADIIGNPGASINETAKNVFVLTYHVISKYPPKDDYEISYDQFKENMFTLKRLGYNTISLEDLYMFLNGEKDVPDKSFVLTFDDGAKGGFYNADPILKALNYTAVMFVIAGQSLEGNQSAYYLNYTELLAVEQTGRWELESHTYKSHYRLQINPEGEKAPALTNKLWLSEQNRAETDAEFFDRVNSDLEKSKKLLEDYFNKPVTSFALPYGDFGERGSNYAMAHNIVYNLTNNLFKMIFYEFPIKNNLFKGNYPSPGKNSYLVVRLPADSFRTPEKLLQRIESSRVIELPYSEEYTNYDRWPRISGEASFNNNSMVLQIVDNSSDNIISAYLDGSYLWRDYQYSIRLGNDGASMVSLISRLDLENNYVSCQYTDESLSLVRLNKRIYEKLISKEMPQNITLRMNTYLSMSVSGSNVKCFVNGYEVINAEVQNMSPHGGVGIKAEGFKAEDKNFIFKEITITEVS